MLKLSAESIFFNGLLGVLRLATGFRKTATYSRDTYSFCFILARNCLSKLSPGQSILKDLSCQLERKRMSKEEIYTSFANNIIATIFAVFYPFYFCVSLFLKFSNQVRLNTLVHIITLVCTGV